MDYMLGGGEGVRPGGGEGVAQLVAALVAAVPPEPRRPAGPFLLAVDHCFSMRGQGTVLTGTVLAGSLQARRAALLPAPSPSKPILNPKPAGTPRSSAAPPPPTSFRELLRLTGF